MCPTTKEVNLTASWWFGSVTLGGRTNESGNKRQEYSLKVNYPNAEILEFYRH